MVISMEMDSGRTFSEALGGYGEVDGDEVLNAGWAEVPRSEARLEEAVVSAHREPARADIEGFMARLYACQE